jgi:hypothetical protein
MEPLWEDLFNGTHLANWMGKTMGRNARFETNELCARVYEGAERTC